VAIEVAKYLVLRRSLEGQNHGQCRQSVQSTYSPFPARSASQVKEHRAEPLGNRIAEATRGVIAIDGRTLRHSFDTASATSALHMVSAWGCKLNHRPPFKTLTQFK
jgi:hypothetical protein